MRTHIAKSLQVRCKVIQNAIKTYNAAALALNPPRPTLDWSRVSHYSFLEEFDLLRNTRQDIRDKRWTDLAVRETMKQHQHVKRAHEEIRRCNTEIRRLHTSIVDEAQFFNATLKNLEDSYNPLHGAIRSYIRCRRRVNDQIMGSIHRTYSLDGFTGNPSPGVRKNTQQGPQELAGTASQVGDMEHPMEGPEDDDNEDVGDIDGDDDAVGDIGELIDYVSNLSVV
jgi:hypothetical protein